MDKLSTSYSLINDTLYGSNKVFLPKIHSIRDNEINESKSSSFHAEQSHQEPSINSITSNGELHVRPPLVKQFYSGSLKMWLPISLHPSSLAGRPEPDLDNAGQEACAVGDTSHVDIRPHIFDPILSLHLLCDSGSQVSAFPPEPGDTPTPGVFLKAANGSKMSCYGYKVVSIRIGHKDYKYKVIKADMESPIWGWDFMKLHKLDLRWNDQDQITIFDKKDNTSSVLELK